VAWIELTVKTGDTSFSIEGLPFPVLDSLGTTRFAATEKKSLYLVVLYGSLPTFYRLEDLNMLVCTWSPKGQFTA
jgi:hypothetical protein